jgi:bacterioferritin-associated ferredoxin
VSGGNRKNIVSNKKIENIVHAVQGFPSVLGWMGVRSDCVCGSSSYQIVNDFLEENGLTIG